MPLRDEKKVGRGENFKPELNIGNLLDLRATRTLHEFAAYSLIQSKIA